MVVDSAKTAVDTELTKETKKQLLKNSSILILKLFAGFLQLNVLHRTLNLYSRKTI
jgi:hypothetical protein